MKKATTLKRYSARLIASAAGLPVPQEEYRFHTKRRWRFDFAWPQFGIALEVEGGIWTGGRHSRGKGAKADMQKYNHAAAEDWLVFRCTPDRVYAASVLNLVREAYIMRRNAQQKKQSELLPLVT
jgi:hypothetical protein